MEAYAIRDGVRLALDLVLNRVTAESDSLEVVTCRAGDPGRLSQKTKKHDPERYEIKVICQKSTSWVEGLLALREANEVDHHCASRLVRSGENVFGSIISSQN